MELMRLLIDVVLFSGLAFGLISLAISRRKSRGLIGVSLGTIALLLGGSRVPIRDSLAETPYLALDWLLLSIFVTALIFIPLERFFWRVKQRIFRRGWRTDLAHYGVSHLLVQITVLLTMLPAAMFFHWAVSDTMQAAVASQPLWLQFLEALLVADLFAYVSLAPQCNAVRQELRGSSAAHRQSLRHISPAG